MPTIQTHRRVISCLESNRCMNCIWYENCKAADDLSEDCEHFDSIDEDEDYWREMSYFRLERSEF